MSMCMDIDVSLDVSWYSWYAVRGSGPALRYLSN